MIKHNKIKRVSVLHIILFVFIFLLCLLLVQNVSAQGDDIDFILDVTSQTKLIPQLLKKPGIDLSGRGFNKDPTWPQNLAAPEAIEQVFQSLDLTGGIFRIQFDLWEFVQLAKNKQMQARFLKNYSTIINELNSKGAVTILNLYGMPPGLGKALDKKCSPWDIKAFKELVKDIIRYLSCEKGYNVWYEVWNAPDLDNFFVGQKQEYFNIYKAVAESIKELEGQFNRNIPIGGPGVTWWFHNLDSNTVLTPEKSLIYELLRFCSHRRLPIDFVSWHAYTSDPLAESEVTCYKKIVPELVQKWLSYFGFDPDIPLIISEWNYDAGLNFEPKRGWESYVTASFLPSRIRNILKTDVDYQIFFCLEDFKNNKEGVDRNVGLFWFEPEYAQYTGGPKSTFNVMRMLNSLGNQMYQSSRLDNEFVGIIATETATGVTILIYYYIDPNLARNYLARQMAALHPKNVKQLVKLMDSDQWQKVLNKKIPLESLKLHRQIQATIQEVIALHDKFNLLTKKPQTINLKLINMEGDYAYKKYIIDESCRLDCAFQSREEKELREVSSYQETLAVQPYSVIFIKMDKAHFPVPKVEEEIPEAVTETKQIPEQVSEEAEEQQVSEETILQQVPEEEVQQEEIPQEQVPEEETQQQQEQAEGDS